MTFDDSRPADRTLVLASRRVPHDLATHARGRVAVAVSNAADHYGRLGRADKVARDTRGLERAGFTVRPVDLREHTGDDLSSLRDAVAGAALIWVGGGNTFWLLHQLRRSGLADLLPGLLAAGVTYAGESAGAVACAPTLAGVDREDDPTLSPDPTQPGLGLVPFLAWAHWNPARPGHATRHVPLPGVATPMYRIADGEYLLVTANRVQLRRNVPARPAATVDTAPTLF